jgi:phasin family protein
MEEQSSPSDNNAEAEKSIDQARGAMENYLEFFQKTIFTPAWAQTDLNKKIQNYAGKNVATAFEFAQRLIQAKDLQEVVRIQTEFMQTQVKALSEQAKEIGETATKAAGDAPKNLQKTSGQASA